jgi:RNA polymerase sigma factor (sigma-70 family)
MSEEQKIAVYNALQHSNAITRVAVQCRTDRDDLVHDVYLKLLGPSEPKPITELTESFFASVAKSVAIDKLRSDKREKVRRETYIEFRARETDFEEAVHTAEKNEIVELLLSRINSLPLNQRDVLSNCDLGSKRIAEYCLDYELNYESVKACRQRAFKSLSASRELRSLAT